MYFNLIRSWTNYKLRVFQLAIFGLPEGSELVQKLQKLGKMFGKSMKNRTKSALDGGLPLGTSMEL